MKNKKKYKFTSGIQQIEMDSPDKSKIYNYQTKKDGQDYLINSSLNSLSGKYGGAAQIAGTAADFIKNNSKNKQSGTVAGSTLKGAGTGAAFEAPTFDGCGDGSSSASSVFRFITG